MNTDNSWSRCADEFSPLVENVDDEFSLTVKRQRRRRDSNDALSSRKSIVATDIALANIERIETTELVSRWIARGIRTPPILDQTPSSPPSDVPTKSRRSPVIECRPKFVRRDAGGCQIKKRRQLSPDLTRSPIIGEAKFARKKRRIFDSSSEKKGAGDVGRSSPINSPVDESLTSVKNRRSSETKEDFTAKNRGAKSSPILDLEEEIRPTSPGKEQNLGQAFLFVDANRYAPRNIERVSSSVTFEPVLNEEGNLFGFKETRDSREDRHALTAKEITAEFDDAQLSRDLFDDETDLANLESIPSGDNQRRGISTSIREETGLLVSPYRGVINRLKTEDDNGEEILGNLQANLSTRRSGDNEGYFSELRAEKDSSRPEVAREGSSRSFVQDTEELLPPSPQQNHGEFIGVTTDSGDLIERGNEFSILDSEFSPEKKKFVTDTERIDYDTSSEHDEGSNPDVGAAKISILDDSDSDKTVSDVIEEPLTQDYVESSKPVATVSSLLPNSISAVSSKIPETISSNEPSSIDISVESTPPSYVQETTAAMTEHLLSTKKKKLRPKKGSLVARLRKLVSGQASYVRLWRYQISHHSVFRQSSTPFVALSVIESWVRYEKNFYLSKVLEDSHGLLRDSFGEARAEEIRWSNLVVMTNPEFVGPVKMLPGTIFKVYSPWNIFNHESRQGDPILHAVYLQSVPISSKEEENTTESRAALDRLEYKVTHEYDCPCLQNDKIDDSCSIKFTNEKVNVMDVIFNEK